MITLLREEREVLYICCGIGKDKATACEILRDTLPAIREPEIRRLVGEVYKKVAFMQPEEYERINLTDVAEDLAIELGW